MTRPDPRTRERRATDDKGSFPISDLEESFEGCLGIHQTPEVMDVQLLESRSMGGIHGDRQGG